MQTTLLAVFMLALSDLSECKKPTRGQCERAEAKIDSEEPRCKRLSQKDRDDDESCSVIGSYRLEYDGKCEDRHGTTLD